MTEKTKVGFSWPNNARLAVAVTCLLETWSGDKGPPFSVQTTSLKPGTHDRAAMTWGTYGVRAGVWRLLKILDDNEVPATFCANAHALELSPPAVVVVQQGAQPLADERVDLGEVGDGGQHPEDAQLGVFADAFGRQQRLRLAQISRVRARRQG